MNNNLTNRIVHLPDDVKKEIFRRLSFRDRKNLSLAGGPDGFEQTGRDMKRELIRHQKTLSSFFDRPHSVLLKYPKDWGQVLDDVHPPVPISGKLRLKDYVKHAKEHQPTIVEQSEPSQPPILDAGSLINRVIGEYKPTNRFASEPGEFDIDPGHDHGLDAGYGDFPKNIYGTTLHPRQLNRRV